MVIKICRETFDTRQIKMWLEEEVYDVNFVYYFWCVLCVWCDDYGPKNPAYGLSLPQQPFDSLNTMMAPYSSLMMLLKII